MFFVVWTCLLIRMTGTAAGFGRGARAREPLPAMTELQDLSLFRLALRSVPVRSLLICYLARYNIEGRHAATCTLDSRLAPPEPAPPCYGKIELRR